MSAPKVDTRDADARKAAGRKVRARAKARAASAPALSERQKDATIEDQRAALEAWRVEARRLLDALALASPCVPASAWYAIGRAQAVALHALGIGPDDEDRELLDAIERTADERARLWK